MRIDADANANALIAALPMPKTTKKPTQSRTGRRWLRADALSPRPRTLKAWLHANGDLTQRAFATRLGVSQAMVSMLTKGERAARPRLAARIEQLTGLPHDLFLDLGVKKPRKRGPPGAGDRLFPTTKRGTDDDDASDGDNDDRPPDPVAD